MDNRRGPSLEDIDLLPDDDHQQYELLDGLLLVTPAPVPLYQRAVAQLFVRLAGQVPPGVELLFAPLDWRPDNRTSLQPGVLAVRAQDVPSRCCHPRPGARTWCSSTRSTRTAVALTPPNTA